MSKILVLAEKPSVGRDIARVLNCTNKNRSYIEGNKYIVTWGLGHLVTLADPEGYDKKYQEWKMEDLPMMPEKMQTEVIAKTKGQYHAVKDLIQRKDVESIVIATDAGREGELVARWILLKAKNNKPCKRLWISSVTDKAIKEGFSKLKDAKEYDNLYYAAVSRAEADWLVGMNATRALTCKYNAQLSCGRVQTPTLAMIAAREDEIKKFKPESYYSIQIRAGGVTFDWNENGNTRTFSKEKAEKAIADMRGQDLRIEVVEKTAKKKNPPLLYDLTELQREANKRFGYSAKETLNIMQRLYENHKVITYPRTDSRYLTSDLVGTIKDRLKAVSTGAYKKLTAPLISSKIESRPGFVNNGKVSDHHAVIPTEQYPEFTHMTNEEKKIYDLIVRRFLAVLYPACEYEETTIKGTIGGKGVLAKGKVVKTPGWNLVYSDSALEHSGEDDLDETADMKTAVQIMPDMKKGDILKGAVISMKEGKTKAPSRFTEASLLSAMENPEKYLENTSAGEKKQMAKILGETGGLGTVATRADIIEKLFSSFVVEKKGNEIYVTSKGRQLLELVPSDLKKPEMTADWELKLSKISSGNLQKERFLKEIKNYTVSLIDEIKTSDGKFRHDNLTNKTCPQCGKKLLAVNGKKSKMLVCQDRECGYRETVSHVTNARCPVCHKKMEMSGKGDAAIFFCSCGHKEKLSKFEERRKKEGAGVSKRDVAAYMRKQESAPANNPFADALKNILNK